jgi:hypothetical protein
MRLFERLRVAIFPSVLGAERREVIRLFDKLREIKEESDASDGGRVFKRL